MIQTLNTQNKILGMYLMEKKAFIGKIKNVKLSPSLFKKVFHVNKHAYDTIIGPY